MAESNAERKEVEEYLRKHNLQVVMNEVINSIIKERADHPLDAIARALQDRDEQGIIAVTGREVLDASGRPTIAVDVKTARGTFTASVPRGEKAEWAAVESRDADTSRYAGGGVTMAVKMVRALSHTHTYTVQYAGCILRVAHFPCGTLCGVAQVNEVIGPALVGLDPSEQKTVDKKLTDLDGTDDKSNFGANTILAVSMAVCRAGAAAKKKPLFRHLANLANLEEVCMPVPAFTVMEGGTNAYSNLPVKEILVMPTSAESFSEALRIGFEVYNAVRAAVAEKEDGEEPSEVFKGAAGGWAVEIDEFEDALQLLTAAVEKAGYTEQVRFAVNLDGNKLLVRPPTEEGEEEGKGEVDEEDEDRKYDLSWKLGDDSKVMESEELSKMLSELIEKYPIVSMEDPFANSDKATYTDFNTTLSEDLQVVGDRLVVRPA